MGLYIPDLRLPADGDFELWIAARKDGSFTYNVRGGWQDGKKKAVPVLPHGRLIDADAVIDLVMQYCHDDDGMCSKAGADLRELLDEIENLPTIIPASEEET